MVGTKRKINGDAIGSLKKAKVQSSGSRFTEHKKPLKIEPPDDIVDAPDFSSDDSDLSADEIKAEPIVTEDAPKGIKSEPESPLNGRRLAGTLAVTQVLTLLYQVTPLESLMQNGKLWHSKERLQNRTPIRSLDRRRFGSAFVANHTCQRKSERNW